MTEYQSITQKELEELISKQDSVIVDVQEKWEFADFNIGGINIPPHEITERLDELNDYKNIIVVCTNGTRSAIVARLLSKKLPDKKIYHLEEGIY
ncbi:MAG: rhodanese-like domain-containing protein [Spirosomaceae bacterium]|jgi:rhodanese-related sulfurtransferase|nr:rhodanese-like domain-containing protein [Spirosomataceae bacterium]